MAEWNPYDQTKASDFFDAYWMFGVDNGFDVVIGNPPYVQLQNNHGKLANIYNTVGYECFSRSGDIYQLFYECGYKQLKEHGHLCFITSNKWMRAAYGEKTRAFFTDKTSTKILIDFAGQRVFESATVDVNIILIEKNGAKQETFGCIIKEKCKDNMTDYIRHHGTHVSFPKDGTSWVILSDIEQRIKEKIERAGKPLKDWDINIYRGILTGCNEAFIINKATRDELIEKCPKSVEIIRPILRGRDIERYKSNFSDLYLINVHNGNPSKKIFPIDIKKYPAVKDHLDKYWKRIKDRNDQGVTPYNLRSCAYMDDFSKQKIIWGELSDKTKFALDENGYYCTLNTTFLMTGDRLIFLVCYLNSSLSEYLFSKIGSTSGVGTIRWLKFTIEQLFVPDITVRQEHQFEYLWNRRDLFNFKDAADDMIYQICNLSPEEIAFIQEYCLSI
jgi:hypothetical protein